MLLDGDVSVQKYLHDAALARPVHARLERRGAAVTVWTSEDGERWRWDVRLKFERLPERLKLGVVAEAEAGVGLTAVFDNFKLTPLKPKKD